MSTIKLLAVAILLVLITGATTIFAQESTPFSINESPLPAPTGFVNDYAAVIDPATKQQLEAKIQELKDTTNPQVELAVVVVRTTGERAIFDYSLAVARGWKIGTKEDDNPSALLFVAIDDRKYFTHVSRDLEDELPDGIVGSLQRQHLVPEFRKQNYSKGISDTVDAYIAAIKNKNTAAPANADKPARGKTNNGVAGPGLGVFCCGAIGLVLLLMIFARSKSGGSKNDRDRWGGGGFGGGGGGAASALPWIIGGMLAGSGSSSGSNSWGGGGSSDGGGWGGFGGGGDFGGGGGGGDW